MWISKRTQHAALSSSSNRKTINTGSKSGALLTGLSKASGCLDHSLLVGKLHWYGLSPLSLELTFFYFSNRTHRTKIKECFSNRFKTEHSVPQGSILGPLIINTNSIEDCEFEYENSEIKNYADEDYENSENFIHSCYRH